MYVQPKQRVENKDKAFYIENVNYISNLATFSDNNFSDFLKQTNENLSSTLSELRAKGSITEIAEELIDDILKPHYVAQQEDDWWKKKRKGRR